MSFSTDVKDELSGQLSTARHCRLAELAALMSVHGRATAFGEKYYRAIYQTDNIAAARKCSILLREAFGIQEKILVRSHSGVSRSRTFRLEIENPKDAERVLRALKFIDDDGSIINRDDFVNGMLIGSSCCKRAFVRGLFIAAGSVTDPNKPYHFEIVCQSEKKAEQLREVLASFNVEARIVLRKNHYVLYIKGGDYISDMFNIMEAHNSLFSLENVRIEKELRGMINRVNNCDNANINKTVQAAVEQSDYIRYIFENEGLNSLPENLRQIAELRLEYPEAPLKELGAKLDPPLGKSGVNHRLNKLKEISKSLRESKERNNDS